MPDRHIFFSPCKNDCTNSSVTVALTETLTKTTCVYETLRRTTSGTASRLCDHSATIVQGERRGELAWPLLSRSRWSPLQLVCNGKGTKENGAKQAFFWFVSKLFPS